uniref:RecF/RecN/SMC N-terminal domain-containing protein n=1 Tax=Heterosigma akashiwo TaxID=2829 RepID=A0A6V1TI32_HETAK
MLNKRGMLLQKREDNTRKIQELGSLPAAEVESHKDRSIKDLMKRLHKCNEKLKKFSHVNKKALDQYVNFSEQRGLLMERRDEVDRGAKAIEELIEHLDQQKDEAILRTFKGVSHHFSEVFKSLVPDGKGEMLMKTAADQNEEDDGAEESKGGDSSPTSVNQFVGVQIRVSFSGDGEQFLMSQLSGGQKALVALAIIFAIQRCDPAPFYLFDELDQALDSSYRAQVAALIQQQARDEDNPAQFITSTFRPELVSVADKTYGISHQNKVSNINPLGKEDALDFVRDLMNEEERVDGEEGAKQVPAPDSSAAGVAGPKKKRKSSS